MSPDAIAAAGAFLSGIASVLTAAWYTRRAKRSAEADCDKRLAEYDHALHEGVELGRHPYEDRQAS